MSDALDVRLGSQACGVCGHSDSADSLGLFGHRRASLLISDAFIQNHPDQLTDAMRNRPDGLVVAETRNETAVDDLEDASFTFDGSEVSWGALKSPEFSSMHPSRGWLCMGGVVANSRAHCPAASCRWVTRQRKAALGHCGVCEHAPQHVRVPI